MEAIIPLMNKLQMVSDTVGMESLHLPQIVVVGTQSSGKSSVLENLVGRSFLPRGIGIVTRRPLILQLINVKKENLRTGTEEWAEFQHRKNYVFVNFDDVREEIEFETNKLAGKNKSIREEPIYLKIFSTKVVNLTLVDLPGLTKVPVGDQPEDIESRIKNLVLKYIENPNAIILAIVTANTDMATNESLQLAREYDPSGTRTLAVVTKLDIMDNGTDAVDILCGRIIPVKLGIIGVVNRSQRDITANKTIEDAIRDEATYFQQSYPTLAYRNGTPYLAKRLNQILVDHIRVCLPELKHRISRLNKQNTEKLYSLGEILSDKSSTLLQIISTFSSAYCSALDGTSRHIQTSELCGGARICYIFHETLSKALDSIQPLKGLTKMDILTALRNATGTRSALFVPEICFELLVKKQIVKLEEPSLRCAELIHAEMQRIIHHCGVDVQQDLTRFPKLFDSIVGVVSELLRRRLPETKFTIETLIQLELAFINTMHPEFRRDADSVFNAMKNNPTERNLGNTLLECTPTESPSSRTQINQQGNWLTSFLPSGQIIERGTPPVSRPGDIKRVDNSPDILRFGDLTARKLTEREKRECHIIEKLITTYFCIVKKSIQDSVPKAIMYSMVNNVKENIQKELIHSLYKDELTDELLQEPQHVATLRDETRAVLHALQTAEGVLSEIQDAQYHII